MALARYATSRLPTPHGEFTITVYRTGMPADLGGATVGPGPEEHVALSMGDLGGDLGGNGTTPVLCRVHSSCFTSEVLGSQRCDCRAQLDLAMAKIAAVGRGVVIYLVQEGRGIGLGNKIRAYALQDQGHDTVEANLELGFAADGRSYDLAAAMLRDLGVHAVELMTNNPQKIAGLEAAGIIVRAHTSHWAPAPTESTQYLAVKKAKLGHIE